MIESGSNGVCASNGRVGIWRKARAATDATRALSAARDAWSALR